MITINFRNEMDLLIEQPPFILQNEFFSLEGVAPDVLVEYYAENQQLLFYGWWQCSACLFAFLAFLAIWWHLGRKRNDFGQVWLALSILCWSASGYAELNHARQWNSKYEEILSQWVNTGNITDRGDQLLHELNISRPSSLLRLEGARSIFSLFNSLFILFALPWFRYIPRPIAGVIKSRYWIYIVGLPFLFSFLPTITKIFNVVNVGIISELDVYFSTLTLIFLGLVLWESFAKRRLQILAWLSVMAIVLTFSAQLLKLSGYGIDQVLFSAIFKTCLIMIFFALGLSWVKELAENIIPASNKIFMRLTHQQRDGVLERIIALGGFPGQQEREIVVTSTHYDLMKKFASKKLNRDNDWLEIRPKAESRSNRNYDINDHNEIKRLLASLLDGLFGKGTWTKDHHGLPLKSALFETSRKRDRKIRLRIPPENITMT
jgi:hypothetical protein